MTALPRAILPRERIRRPPTLSSLAAKWHFASFDCKREKRQRYQINRRREIAPSRELRYSSPKSIPRELTSSARREYSAVPSRYFGSTLTLQISSNSEDIMRATSSYLDALNGYLTTRSPYWIVLERGFTLELFNARLFNETRTQYWDNWTLYNSVMRVFSNISNNNNNFCHKK